MDVSSAGPLVLETLARACSQDAAVLKPAESQLTNWETQPGFYTILTTIFSDHSIDVNVRWLAVLYFKKGIDRYWRRNAPNGISEEEKEGLRRRLIQNFNEPVHQIATQLAVLIAKIARLDCPRSWPELIPTLLHTVKVNDALMQQRVLLTLHHVTKTLSSKRLSQDRKVFEELTNNIFAYIFELWTLHNDSVFEILSSNSNNIQGLMVAIDNSLLTLKVLRKLLVYGFPSPKENLLAMQFLEQVFTKLNIYLKSKDQLHLNSELVAKREKIATLLTKVLLDTQDNHPESYIKFIQPTLQLCIFYNFTQQGKVLSYERLKVNAFNMLRTVLRCEVYRPAKIIEETKNPLTLEAHRIKMAFFTSSTLTEMCKQLILDYFPLTQDDLECWQSDPEGFVCDEGGDAWKFSLRPCTENLYLTLFKEFRDTFTPIVLDLVKKYQGVIDPNDLQAVLQKDSVYNAVGLASFDLYDDVDFDQWFTNHLLQELQNDHPNYRIIHRRVTWLTGCWVGVKMSQELRPTLCEVLLTLLQPNKDLVVRFEAANTLRRSIDDFEFQIDQFLPFLQPSFGSLFQLLKDVNECETKMKVLHVMSCVIESVDTKIQPHAGALIQYLPSLWHESEDHDMLRCAILTTLINLVQGLGVMCVSMYDLLLPVILMSTDVTQECHVYLVEDGLQLWHMTLHQSPVMTPQLLALYDNLPELMESTTEHLKIIVKIIEAYLLLGAKEFMQKYASSFVNCITSVLTDLRSEGVIVLMKLVELVLKLFPDEGPRVFASLLPNIFSWAVHGEHYTTEKTVYYSILARVLLQNQTFFFQMLNTIASNSHKQVAEVCGDYLDNWVEHCDTAAQSTVDKKLNTMAMLSLINTNSSVVLERFAGILNIVVETLHSVCGLGEDSQLDRLWLNDDTTDLPDDSQETEHEKRKRQLSRQDPVHTVNLRDYVIQELMTFQRNQGESALNMLMNTLDPKISEQLQEFIT